MIYFDTSYLVRLYYADEGAEAVRALAATDHVACAAHGQAEMIVAFRRKLREGTIRPAAYAALLGQLRVHNRAGAFQWLMQEQEIFSRIADVYEKLRPAFAACRKTFRHRGKGCHWPRDLNGDTSSAPNCSRQSCEGPKEISPDL